MSPALVLSPEASESKEKGLGELSIAEHSLANPSFGYPLLQRALVISLLIDHFGRTSIREPTINDRVHDRSHSIAKRYFN